MAYPFALVFSFAQVTFSTVRLQSINADGKNPSLGDIII